MHPLFETGVYLFPVELPTPRMGKANTEKLEGFTAKVCAADDVVVQKSEVFLGMGCETVMLLRIHFAPPL
jgi:hypothetical protein